MHHFKIIQGGKTNAEKALIMIHGRGGSAADFMEFAINLEVIDYALFAPQASDHSWYPLSFLAKPELNEPWLSSAISYIHHTISEVKKQGILQENIYLLGFSQGACLALEFAARNASKFGGIIGFTGGLIGDKIYPENYSGNFNGTPIFIGTSNPDFHVPVERVYATTNILKEMGANVTEKIYENMGHTINQEEIMYANAILNQK